MAAESTELSIGYAPRLPEGQRHFAIFTVRHKSRERKFIRYYGKPVQLKRDLEDFSFSAVRSFWKKERDAMLGVIR